jgi:hypothetical protein
MSVLRAFLREDYRVVGRPNCHALLIPPGIPEIGREAFK